MSILILDNYDSFTYNLVHLVEQFTDDFEVHRNDKISLSSVDKFDKILISPGPGLPKNAGILPVLLEKYSTSKSILGICLGMQAIVEHFGGRLYNLPNVMHGVSEETVINTKDPLFTEIPKKFACGRYHSWGVKVNELPPDLILLAEDKYDIAMAIKHATLPIKGIQFHPESILTPKGKQLIRNWILIS